MFKKMLVLLAFVSSCGPLKMDTAKAFDLETIEALEISLEMYMSGGSCESIYDFLKDTSLDHNIDESIFGCNCTSNIIEE